MKITTWNVNGLRAILAKGLLSSLQTVDPDVVCLQEIKANPAQLDKVNLAAIASSYNYLAWNPAQRPGYSGVATWSRVVPQIDQPGLGRAEFDGEGRLIANLYPDFWLFNIYFPNGGRDLVRVPYKLDFYACLLDWVDRLHAEGHKVILCGDFNTCHREIDLRHPKANANATGFLPEERAWIDRYLEHGLVDIFRRLYPEKVEYTWWAYFANARKNNTGWRLDYFLISEGLVESVVDVVNHTPIPGSDHCPVTLILRD